MEGLGRSGPPYGEGLDADEREVQSVCIHRAIVLVQLNLRISSISGKKNWLGRKDSNLHRPH
jgi:hypothetical protein